MAGEDLWAAEATLVGDGMQVVAVEDIPGCDRHRAERVAVEALGRDLRRDNTAGSGVDGGLHLIADHAAVPGTRCRGAGIGAGQGNLPVRRGGQGLLHCLQPRDLRPDPAIAVGTMGNLVGPGRALVLPVDADHLGDMAFNISLQMGEAAGDLVPGEVPVVRPAHSDQWCSGPHC